MRHKEPDFVTAWMRGEVPKCCHLCIHYSRQGVCKLHNGEPPEEFARSIGVCDAWESYDRIPF